MRRGSFLVLAIILGLMAFTALTNSADSIDPGNAQENTALVAGNLDTNHLLGQTFQAHFDRLNTIAVRWIVSQDFAYDPAGQVTLHLRKNISDPGELATASIGLASIHDADYGKFIFTPIENSADQNFYFFLDGSHAGITRGTLSLWASGEDNYPNGQLWVDGLPTAQDLTFRAYYNPSLAMLWQSLIDLVARNFAALAFSILLILVPGFLIILAPSFRFDSFTLALLTLTILALIVALLQIRDLAAPLWVDSPTHAGYIESLVQGHLPLERFYHLGYHVLTAFVVRVTNAPLTAGMLIVGQVLLTQTGLSVFALARKLSGSRIAGLASAIVVWFLAPTPTYFVTWGRYPLILGAVFLPLAMLGAIYLIESKRLTIWQFTFATITLIALIFSQIRLSVFYLIFLAIFVVFVWRSEYKLNHKDKKTQNENFSLRAFVPWWLLKRIIFLGGSAFAFGAIWLVALSARGSTLQSILALNDAAPVIDLGTAQSVIVLHHGGEIIALAAIAIIIGFIRRTKIATIVAAWYIGVALASFGSQWLSNRPYVEPALVVLMGFLPMALLVGDLAQWATQFFEINHQDTKTPREEKRNFQLRAIVPWWLNKGLAIVLIVLVGLAGIQDAVSIVNPATILFFEAERSAMQWIESHTPTDAKFLINSFAWFDTTYTPSDGGTWIPHLAYRPVDFLPNEHAGASIDAWMRERQIDFVYLGRRSGTLTQNEFISQPKLFSLVYDHDGVKIFQLR